MLGSIASTLVVPALLAAGEPSNSAEPALVSLVLAPSLVLALCVFAGIGTLLLLPSRRDVSFRRIGAAMLISAALIFVTLLLRLGTKAGVGIYFWIFSAIALIGAVRVITHARPVYSALYFVLTVFASAGLFILLDAQFMAAALVLIYAGAILITYVFVIMLASQAKSPGQTANFLSEYDAVSREPLVASMIGFTLMGILLFVIFDRAGSLSPKVPTAQEMAVDAPLMKMEGGTQKLGVYLFQHETVNLELAGLLLTVSMVGAIVIARKKVVYHEGPGMTGDVTVAPGTPIDDNPFSIPVYGTDNPRQKSFPET